MSHAKTIERQRIQDTAWFNMNWEAKRACEHVKMMHLRQSVTDKAMPYWQRKDLEDCVKRIQKILEEDDKR